jgi:hypothetical protein
MSKDNFSQGGIGVAFVRKGGKVAGFTLNMGRVSGIEFVRK